MNVMTSEDLTSIEHKVMVIGVWTPSHRVENKQGLAEQGSAGMAKDQQSEKYCTQILSNQTTKIS
jgi:hypothetical protein